MGELSAEKVASVFTAARRSAGEELKSAVERCIERYADRPDVQANMRVFSEMLEPVLEVYTASLAAATAALLNHQVGANPKKRNASRG